MDLPVNFAEDWVMKVCPVGKRCLVVAGKVCVSACKVM